jgi:hypothetical protein
LLKLKSLIAEVWTSEIDLESKVELYKGYLARLHLLGQGRSETDKLETFKAVTSTLLNVVYFLRKYNEDVQRDINQRTLVATLDYIVSQIPNFTSQSAGWAGGAVSNNEVEIERRVAAGIKKGIAEYRKQAIAAGELLPSNGAGGPVAHSVAPAGPGWCFKHGPGHHGRKCKYMLARPAVFTADFLGATHQCTIRGVKSFPDWVEA